MRRLAPRHASSPRRVAAWIAIALCSSCSHTQNQGDADIMAALDAEAYDEGGPSGEALGEGEASYYADALQGRKTASGERYDKSALTAAHRQLPFGTCLRVVNVENGKTVQVRVNDRGPFIEGRIIDVSGAAATQLDMVKQGVARVTLFRC